MGFLYLARNGTATAITAAAGLLGGGRLPVPVPPAVLTTLRPPLLPPAWPSVLSVSPLWNFFSEVDFRPIPEASTALCPVRFPFLILSVSATDEADRTFSATD